MKYVPPFSLRPRPSLYFRYVCVSTSSPKSLPNLFSVSFCKLLNAQRQRYIQGVHVPILYKPVLSLLDSLCCSSPYIFYYYNNTTTHHNDYSSYFALFFRLTVTVQQVYILYRNLEYMLKRSVVSRTCVLVYGILYHDPQIKAILIRC